MGTFFFSSFLSFSFSTMDPPFAPFLDCLKQFKSNCNDFLTVGYVPKYDINDIDGIYFLREHVAQNRPCICKNGLRNWPATKTWSFQYLIEKYENKSVKIDITPDGFGDAIKSLNLVQKQCEEEYNDENDVDIFIKPAQVEISLKQFSKWLINDRIKNNANNDDEKPH